MTWPPAASIRAAAAITSMTMKGGTWLRPDACNRLLARSLNVASIMDICYLTPAHAKNAGLVPRTSRIRRFVKGISRLKAAANHYRSIHAAQSADKKSLQGRRHRDCGGDGARADGGDGAGRSAVAARHRDRADAARLHPADSARRGP